MESTRKSRKKNSIGIRLNGVSTPFGGISWEYKEEKQEEYEAIQLLFIYLGSKRLITMPFSRNNRIPFEKDIEWCSLSALDLKAKILGIIYKYTLPSELINELQSMINHCNSLLEEVESLKSNKIIINNSLDKRDDFLKLIDSFKKSLFTHIKSLSEKYSIEFKEVDNDF